MKTMQAHPIPLIATITYCLSETGCERSVKAGGSGTYHQNFSGPIAPEDVKLFEVTRDGSLSAVFNVMEFDEPQPFSLLLAHLRERRRRLTAIRALMEAEALARAAFSRTEPL
jgi:hypothetical protein